MIQHFKVLLKQARHNMMSDNNAAKAIPNLLRENVGPDWVTRILRDPDPLFYSS